MIIKQTEDKQGPGKKKLGNSTSQLSKAIIALP